MKLQRCDADVPWEPNIKRWVVEGLIRPGVRGFIWSGPASTHEEAIAKAKALFGEKHFPLLVHPSYVVTGEINPVFVETE